VEREKREVSDFLCLEPQSNYMADESDAPARRKRGGGTLAVSLNLARAATEIPEVTAPRRTIRDKVFQRKWGPRGHKALACRALRGKFLRSDRLAECEAISLY